MVIDGDNYINISIYNLLAASLNIQLFEKSEQYDQYKQYKQ